MKTRKAMVLISFRFIIAVMFMFASNIVVCGARKRDLEPIDLRIALDDVGLIRV